MAMHRGSQDVSDFDFRLQHPFSCVVSGPSNSGKSYFVKLLLEKGLNIISKKIENIVWLYDCWQTLYDDLLQLYDIKFIQGIPQSLNDDDLLPVTTAYLLVVNDLNVWWCQTKSFPLWRALRTDPRGKTISLSW